jgi:hypothetical protein
MKTELEEAAERYVKSDLKKTPLYGMFNDTFIEGAKWQQEQDNKELAMWKLAVEKQEARCTALRGVISDLQDKKMYNEEDMRETVNWEAVYEESLSMQKCSNAGFLSKINELKEQIKTMYSEEEAKEAIRFGFDKGFCSNSRNKVKNLGLSEQEWVEQFKKK